MRTFISISIVLSFLIYSMASFGSTVNEDQTEEQTLHIVSSPELFDLTSSWATDFGELHPEQKIEISQMADETTLSAENLYFLTGEGQETALDESAWKMVIGHDVVVPVIHSENPLLEEIYRQGLTTKDFAHIVSENPDWAKITGGAKSIPIHCYISDNQQVISRIAGFTQTETSGLRATRVGSAEEVISSVRQDVYAVGFCKLSDALNAEKNDFASQISILPFDKNENGRIDGFENIYENPKDLARGVWIGKYPRELSGDIYAVAATEPREQAALDFLAWLNNDGQDTLATLGYAHLSGREKTSNMLALTNPTPPTAGPGGDASSAPSGWLWVLGALAVTGVVVFILSKRKHQKGVYSEDIEITPALNTASISAPAGLYYDKTHTWAFMEQNGLVKIGIDDFLQHITGPLTQIKMKKPGEKVRKGEKVLSLIREGKQLEIYSPVTGVIKQQNQTLLSAPDKINSAPYTEGWVYQVEPGNWMRETRFMFMAEKFNEWLEDEFIRLKDFLASSANSNQLVYNHIVLQDGGELTDNVLADLGPEVWEDFQAHFINVSK